MQKNLNCMGVLWRKSVVPKADQKTARWRASALANQIRVFHLDYLEFKDRGWNFLWRETGRDLSIKSAEIRRSPK